MTAIHKSLPRLFITKTPTSLGLALAFSPLLFSLPALAQMDFTGEWNLFNHEDPGQPPLGDYLGIPFNDAGRMRSDTTAESIWGIPQFQCRPHSLPHQWRGVGGLRITKEVEPLNRDVTAYHLEFLRNMSRPIYMDGRPHPPVWAPHTWSGFSTGRWVGNILEVKTTHLKEGYLKRSGPQTSDAYEMTEYITRNGEYLTVLTIVDDPIYLEEPYVQTVSYRLDPLAQLNRDPCTLPFDENGGEPNSVPHYLPGANTFLTEWLEEASWIPPEAARGGRQTMYPEYVQGRFSATNSGIPPIAQASPVADKFPHDGEVHVMPVQGNVFMLVVDGYNVAVSVGPDGVMLADTGPADMSDKVIAAIADLSEKVAAAATPASCAGTSCPGFGGWTSPLIHAVINSPAPAFPLRYIVNTSSSPERAGGNEKIAPTGIFHRGGGGAASSFSNRGDDLSAAVIAHENTLLALSAASAEPAAWPTDTYWRDSYRLHQFFNGEAVLMYHMPAAHTDGDSIVFFRGSEVIHAGNLYWTTSYPPIDLERGGSIQGIIDGLNRLLDMGVAENMSQGGTWIIPGRGRLADIGDVAAYRNMVTIIRDRVQDMIGKGMTLEQIKLARPTLDFDGRYGATEGEWTTDRFVEAVYTSLSRQ